MFPAMMILGNLYRRLWRQTAAPAKDAPRFDFSDARDAYEAHTKATDDVRSTRAQFRKRR